MGFFRKKINPKKRYNMSEVLSILNQPEYKDYTSIEIERGIYRIITIEESRKLENQMRQKEMGKKVFHERINGGGDYRGIHTNVINYNDYFNRENVESEREIG